MSAIWNCWHESLKIRWYLINESKCYLESRPSFTRPNLNNLSMSTQVTLNLILQVEYRATFEFVEIFLFILCFRSMFSNKKSFWKSHIHLRIHVILKFVLKRYSTAMCTVSCPTVEFIMIWIGTGHKDEDHLVKVKFPY